MDGWMDGYPKEGNKREMIIHPSRPSLCFNNSLVICKHSGGVENLTLDSTNPENFIIKNRWWVLFAANSA
jgi:hypothetical protein